ncbi:MAG: hypothetical protein HY075_03925 [Deltaproteobacteria bacterium]|nr:hypothetical protein [Deltaproteobacteria bacterium]
MLRSPLTLVVATLLATAAPCARAGFSLTPQTLIDATNEAVGDIGALAGLGADLHMYESVYPYGTTKGVDVGASLTAIAMPGSATNALTKLGISNIPHYLPIPKVNIQKAFGAKIVVGSEFIPSIKIQGNTVYMYGFDAQWTAIDRYGMPPIAFRAQFNYSNLVVVSAATYGGDVVTGWKLPIFDVFGGAGYRFVNAKVSNPTSTIPTVPGVNLDATLDSGHFFAGTTVVAGFARLTAEADLTTRGVNTYGTKLSFFF